MQNGVVLLRLLSCAEVMFCLSIKKDMTWMVSSCGVEITSGWLIDSLTSKLDTVLHVDSLLMRLNHCHICLGNADGKFQISEKLRYGNVYISYMYIINTDAIYMYMNVFLFSQSPVDQRMWSLDGWVDLLFASVL